MKHVFTIGIAGAGGALLRILMSSFFQESFLFPFGTWIVNVVATFLLCLLAAGILRKTMISRETEEAITIGFLGSFSTFSAFSIETITLIEQDRWLVAASYFLVSFLGGITAGMLGDSLGKKWIKNDHF